MWPRCSPAEDRGCPGGKTSAQTMAGSQPSAIPFLQMALALGKASSSPVVGLLPHLLPSCWQRRAARTVYQLLTQYLFHRGCMDVCGGFPPALPKRSQKNQRHFGVFQTNMNMATTVAHPITHPSGSAGNTALISRLSPLQEGLALRTPPDGSSFLLRWVPLWSHPPRPQAGLCVHHIWPLFKTPPQSIS